MTFLKTLVASAVMGALVFLTFRVLDGSFGHEPLWARVLQVGGAIIVGISSYVIGCKLFHVRELDQAIAALRPSEVK